MFDDSVKRFKDKTEKRWIVIFDSEDPEADWQLCSDMDLSAILMDSSVKINTIVRCEEG